MKLETYVMKNILGIKIVIPNFLTVLIKCSINEHSDVFRGPAYVPPIFLISCQ